MIIRRVLLQAACLLALVAGQLHGPVLAGNGLEEPDWPCEQVLVPEVSAAVVWAGPPVDEVAQSWRSVPRVEEVVARVTAPTSDPEAAEAAIAAFAASLDPAGRNAMLTALFAGVLETLNGERSMMIDGIKRYSRDQARRAEALGEKLDDMVRLEQDSSDAARAELEALTKTLEIEQRVFDEREKSIEFLCTRPVAVEQRLGLLAREIAAHLD